MTTPRLTVGLVGAGGSAYHHLAGCVHSGLVGRVVLVEPDDDARVRLKRRYGIIKSDHADLAPLLADGDVTVVDVCGPVAGRFAAARQALEAGKHVILDAPATETVAQLDELAALAEERGRLLLCALAPLHLPAHRKLHELLAREAMPPAVHATALTVLTPGGEAEDVRTAAYNAIVALQEFLPTATGVLGARLTDTSAAALLSLPDGVTAQISVLRGVVGERPWGERRLFTAEGMIWLRDNPEDEMPLLVAHGADLSAVKVKAPPDVYEYAAVHDMEFLLECVTSGAGDPGAFAQARAALETWEAVLAADAAATSTASSPPA